MRQESEQEKIVAVDIVLENCEVFRFDVKDFEWIYIRDVRPTYDVCAYGNEMYYRAYGGVELCIAREANRTAVYSPECLNDLLDYTPFQRLQWHPDVTALDLLYSDGTAHYIYVPFDGEETSSLQSTHEDEEGNLCLNIRPYKAEPEDEEEDEDEDEDEDDVPGPELLDRLAHDMARLRNHIEHRLPLTEEPVPWDSSCRWLCDMLKNVNRRIGAMIFPQFLYEDGEDIAYRRLYKEVLRITILWKKKSGPVWAKWRGQEDEQIVQALKSMKRVTQALAQLRHLVEDERAIARWTHGVPKNEGGESSENGA